ncbi:MAG: methylenetetrahydrofolate--tRNA-(uracil(54)-C(5))-methyltransferase (FADH(2)-oxidizing) TrmFO [Clostridiales bacterium]|jgi:tRNA:m(5)U-54 methyltransferase|nr:methylenetetrahydrofolate--tRNA-(uracil(54)-C(5))-methyltransferase (FADH(2)-oxidizing) TrmFO [Clostridiales bacterium]
MEKKISIIGGGLAGSEAAYTIARAGYKVDLYEMKPVKFSLAHSNENLAEIVCSNSFKSNLLTNACGLLKEELRMLDSLLIKIADMTSVPAGQALAVDRELFSKKVTDVIKDNSNINVINEEVGSRYDTNFSGICIEDLIKEGIVVIATGPLTSDSLSIGIAKLINEDSLHFYDAAAPIIEKDSIDFDIAFYGNRYEQEKSKDEDFDSWIDRINNIDEKSYINLPMNKEEYEKFVYELINAEIVDLHEFEKGEIFEGCMPVEVMAKRGIDTLRFGPLKPVGFDDPRTGKRPYAVIQLRQDNSEASLYNIVGFQTNLKFGEQKRLIQMIPGLRNAEIVKYGVMHRNTFINSSKLLDATYNFKKNNDIYFAGQITGVEGYVESISSGMVVAKNVINQMNGMDKVIYDKNTMIGALAKYISSEREDFQPMNANFGILEPLDEKIRDKKMRYQKMADRALSNFKR